MRLPGRAGVDGNTLECRRDRVGEFLETFGKLGAADCAAAEEPVGPVECLAELLDGFGRPERGGT